jgi:asparagine synthase (glutamine-hydrolysing)
MLDPEFLASIDTQAVLRLMDELYAAAPASSMLNKLLYYDWHLTLADDDLRKVGTMCELAGIKVSFPMLHSAVVDVANRVPPGLKMRGLKLRWFFKRAMANFLPREIIEKQKHGFGLPFGQWLKTDTRLAELIFGHLLDLRARRMIRPKFLEALIEQHRGGHPMYFGYAIWDLAMLEAWFKAHAPRA